MLEMEESSFTNFQNEYLGKDDGMKEMLTKVVIGGVTLYCLIKLVYAIIMTTRPSPVLITPACSAEFKKYQDHELWWSEIVPYILVIVLMWVTVKYNSVMAAGIGLLGTCIVPMILQALFPPPQISELCSLEAEKLSVKTEEN